MPKFWGGAKRAAVDGVMRHQSGTDTCSYRKENPILRSAASTKAPLTPRGGICIMLQPHVHTELLRE